MITGSDTERARARARVRAPSARLVLLSVTNGERGPLRSVRRRWSATPTCSVLTTRQQWLDHERQGQHSSASCN